MSDQIAKGEEFEKKAEKKIKGWGLFGSKYEDAAELYEKSANSFKLAKSCTALSLSLSLISTIYLGLNPLWWNDLIFLVFSEVKNGIRFYC